MFELEISAGTFNNSLQDFKGKSLFKLSTVFKILQDSCCKKGRSFNLANHLQSLLIETA